MIAQAKLGKTTSLLAAALLVSVAPAALMLGSHGAAAQEAGEQAAEEAGSGWLQIEADSAAYDPEIPAYVAEGNVVLEYEGRVVKADRVVYAEEAGEVTATGHVTLYDLSGSIIQAETVTLTDDLKDGAIEGILGLLSDGSHLAAASGRREGGVKNSLSYAVYSPCKVVCETEAPLWQIRAKKVVHDQEERTLRYKHAVLEVKGVPVFYTPWFQHPDPTVERRTGLLTPNFSTDSELGFAVQVPFYWAPNDHRDFTIAPKWTTNEGTILFGEYREHVGFGQHRLSGSVTRPYERDEFNVQLDNRALRGHVFGDGRYDLGDDWRAGFDVAWASDDTYLRRYDISRIDSLVNNLYVDRLTENSYFAVNGYSFQGLRQEDIQPQTPFILPMVEYRYRSRPGPNRSVWAVDGNFLALQRRSGLDVYRLSTAGRWALPLTNDWGQKFRLTVEGRGDVYLIDDPARPGDSQVKGRAAPMLAVDWQWPFIRHGSRFQQIFEPVANIVVSPDDSNPEVVPNEDSIDIEFSDLNLFRHNRAPGVDIWENGIRANYGVRYSIVGSKGVQGSLLVGQSWRLSGNPVFPARSGLDDDASDIVTGLTLNIPGYFDVQHSMRLDEEDLSIEKTQVQVYAGPSSLRVRLGYLDVAAQGFDVNLPHRQEINAGAHVRLSDNWSADGNIIQSLDKAVDTIKWAFGLTYEGRCLRLQTELRRNYAQDRDIQPTTSLFFRISLANLG